MMRILGDVEEGMAMADDGAVRNRRMELVMLTRATVRGDINIAKPDFMLFWVVLHSLGTALRSCVWERKVLSLRRRLRGKMRAIRDDSLLNCREAGKAGYSDHSYCTNSSQPWKPHQSLFAPLQQCSCL